jgi:hypothetical protein
MPCNEPHDGAKYVGIAPHKSELNPEYSYPD